MSRAEQLKEDELEVCNELIARKLRELANMEKIIIGSTASISGELKQLIQNSMSLARNAKQLSKMVRELLALDELLKSKRYKDKIYDKTVESVTRGNWLVRKVNCKKCQRCQEESEYFIHGPYLIKIHRDGGGVRWESWGRLDKLVLQFSRELKDDKILQLEDCKKIEEIDSNSLGYFRAPQPNNRTEPPATKRGEAIQLTKKLGVEKKVE